MMATLKYISVLIFLVVVCADDKYHPKPNNVDPALEITNIKPIHKTIEGHNLYWKENARRYIEDQLKFTKNTKRAKNLIMFLGDGMSISTIGATRMYLGGEELSLSFEDFPHYGLVKPYCVDRQVPDSACTATAFLGGIKNNYRGIGVTANVTSAQCNFSEEDVVYSIVKWAQDEGKATGVVTTTRITHATPASAYAHSPHRDWENNAVISSACRNDPNSQIKDIAHQLVYNEEAKKLKVIMGGGTRHMLNNTMQNDEGRFGERTDGRNLIEEWLEERNKEGKAVYISHKQQLDELDVDKTDFLLGLFEHDHCMYRLDVLNNGLEKQEPFLTQMTETAIKMLQKEENGFFLLVEGGRIDHAHHSNYARKSLDETAEFARAIELAKLMTSDDDTLIVVTSDHSHVFTYSGYPYRHDDVLKTTGSRAGDGLRFETLSYANGPGYDRTYANEGNRSDIINDDFTHVSRRYSAMVPLSSETHGGEDIGVYAQGPWSHLFQGSYEQSDIPLAMAYAAKIGPYAERIETTTACTGSDCDSANGVFLTSFLLILSLLVVYFT